jgi:hypothetical protein
MSYDALYFAFFLAGVWLIFALVPWRGGVLLAASIVFYSVAGLRDSLIAAFLIGANYGFQFPILKDRRWLWLALIINFGFLAYFKYRVFLGNAAASSSRPPISSSRSGCRSISSSSRHC